MVVECHTRIWHNVVEVRVAASVSNAIIFDSYRGQPALSALLVHRLFRRESQGLYRTTPSHSYCFIRHWLEDLSPLGEDDQSDTVRDGQQWKEYSEFLPLDRS